MENDCDIQFEKARKLLDTEQFEDAVEAFSDFIALCPESEGAYGNRGLAYMNLGDDARAMEDFRMVVSLNPDDALGYAMIAEALRNLGEQEQALDEAVQAMEIDPEEPMAYLVRGWLFAQAHQFEHARDDLTFFVNETDDPGEVIELLELCRQFAKTPPKTKDNTAQEWTDEKIESALAEKGFSFDFTENPEYEEQDLFCLYAHCIRNMPRRAQEAPACCPIFGYECPGGPEQTQHCRECPPNEIDHFV